MKSAFRSTSPADAGAMREFFASTRGDSALARQDDAAFAWKYWLPHPMWEGSRSYALERDGRIVAHAAVVPAPCVRGQQRFRAFHLTDWVASPTAQGAGVSLFRRILALADAAYVVGGSEMTQQILPVFGFQDLGVATRFVRPLRPLRRFTAAPIKNLRTAAKAARSALWSFGTSIERPPGWISSALSADQVATWLHASTDPSNGIFERTAESIVLAEVPDRTAPFL